MATLSTFDCAAKCLNYVNNGGQCPGFISSNGHTTWFTPLIGDCPPEWWDDAQPPYTNKTGESTCNGYKPVV